jgi:radical SAM superfamily enzyme YgiQ (UPF0313 family)
MLLYLADLGHNVTTISSDVYPLGVANLAAYLKAYLRAPQPVDLVLFREPQDLEAALRRQTPDVLGLSSYSWNHHLSRTFARFAKARDPRVLTLMGGPNFPLTAAEQESFLRSMPEIDGAVRGPTYEGERALLNVMQRFVDVKGSREGLFEEPIPGNMWIDRRTGDCVRGGDVERIADLDEIPSPYLGGWLDPFLSTGYFPLLQIARGCPFSCAFCNSSVASNNRIHRHSGENVKADLLFLAERVKPEITLCFADDNFGMYRQDEEIADYIGFLQEEYGWPRYLRTTTGKNEGERIIRVMRKVKGSLPMTAAVQSLNPVVLKNISRSNIKLQTYRQIQEELNATGMQSYGELILCLPGETKASFMQAVSDLLTTGVKRVSAHQLMLLHGAPLSDPETRLRHGFKTRFRVVARNIGYYADQHVIETEEMVVETPTFSFDDYLDTRVFHLLLTIFYYEGNFEEAFEYARQSGVSGFELVVHLQSMLDQAPPAFRALMDEFLRESQEELFPTPEECTNWAKANYEALRDGTAGGNLLSKYSMIGRFYLTREALAFLRAGIDSALEARSAPKHAASLAAVMDYLDCMLLGVPFVSAMSEHRSLIAAYDVEAWRRDGYVTPLSTYAFAAPITYATIVDAQVRAVIENRLATFGEHPAGLGKFTRTMFARDLRRALIDVPVTALETGIV